MCPSEESAIEGKIVQAVGGDLPCVAWNPAADPCVRYGKPRRHSTGLDNGQLPAPVLPLRALELATSYSKGSANRTSRILSPPLYAPGNENGFGSQGIERAWTKDRQTAQTCSRNSGQGCAKEHSFTHDLAARFLCR